MIRKTTNILHAEIIDTGVGMTKEQVQEIMSGNAKSTAGTKNERGFGFGFQLARHLIESMKGNLEVDSEPERGTNITVLIPL